MGVKNAIYKSDIETRTCRKKDFAKLPMQCQIWHEKCGPGERGMTDDTR
jgi:hypothetical protein